MEDNNFIVGFDFDGVIVNSLSVMEKSWSELSSKHGISIPFSAYKKNIGLKFKMILENIGLNESMHEAIERDYFHGTNKYKDSVVLYPNVKEIFTSFKEAGIRIFIVTSKPRKNTLALLEMFNINVDLLVCADDVTHGKPHIESGVLVKNFFKNDNIFYVGDMYSDAKFATNCNFNFIFAEYGYGNISKSNYVKINNLNDLIKDDFQLFRRFKL